MLNVYRHYTTVSVTTLSAERQVRHCILERTLVLIGQ